MEEAAAAPPPSKPGSQFTESELSSGGSDQGEGGPWHGSASEQGSSGASEHWQPDYTFKLLLVGDSGVGKTSLCMRFVSGRFDTAVPSTVGVDFAVRRLQLDGTRVKLLVWDTAGQERFRALTHSFYRGAAGVIFVYDVSDAATLGSLRDTWMAELASYQPHPDMARMVVANKVDKEQRQVGWSEGAAFAQQHGCLFIETSAKHAVAVQLAFEELVCRILDTPSLLAAAAAAEQQGGPGTVQLGASRPGGQGAGFGVACSC